ncbi:MAG: polysaccharide biosynthesis protein PslG [Solirubrobacteraceae bacterium]|jgi:hypothetical protein|nr:polysaccharide biosynthesis protein PslG [Solirubrobacteraceae bacterium]
MISRKLSHGRRLRLALAAWAVALAALPAAAGAAQPGAVLPNGDLGNGQLQRIQQSGAKHVRIFTSWRMLEPRRGYLDPHIIAQYDATIDRLKSLGIGVYLVVVQTPTWAGQAANSPPPPDAYADFVGRLAARWQGKVVAYEVWNEMDGPIFWANEAPPSEYVALIKAAYPAIKKGDPAALVGTAGLVGNDYDYVNKLYAAGIKGNFDFLGIHTDTGCAFSDPRKADRDQNGKISRWAFTGYREVHAVMLANGDTTPIWMTEIGWQVSPGRCAQAPNIPAGVSTADQADYLTKAYNCLAGDPYVQVASWFSLNDFGPDENTGGGYGLFTFGGAARASLRAFQSADQARPDAGCGLALDVAAASLTVVAPTNGSGASGILAYKATASDATGVRTLAMLIDGKQVLVTSKNTLAGQYTAWRNLRFGPHTVTFRAIDDTNKVTSKSVTVNRVLWGLGEEVATRATLRVSGGTGRRRNIRARLFVVPRSATRFLRGGFSLVFERRVGTAWVAAGRARGTTNISARRTFAPGTFRVTAIYPGYKAFRGAVARRTFVVR